MTLDLRPFKTLVKERCGLLFEERGEVKLAQALKHRVDALAIEPSRYFGRIHADEAEFQELVNLLTINETYFFREPDQIKLLVDRLAPCFLAAKEGQAPVRILSAGCSSGEEPYSLVMALTDKYGGDTARLFHVVGADIDSKVLAKARLGHYSEFSFRGVPEALRQRYFERQRQGYLLKEAVRNQVGFHELNLLADGFPPALRDFDIVFFRNVSIYFDSVTCKTIQHRLASLMRDNGILITGVAETLANDLGVLPLVEDDGLFYFVKGNPRLPLKAKPTAPARPAIARTPVRPPPIQRARMPAQASEPPAATVSPPRHTPPPPAGPAADVGAARLLVRDKRHDEAMPLLDAILSAEPGHAEAALLKAHLLINRRDFAGAEDQARRVLATEAWSIDAFLLLGLAAKWREQTDDAIRWFKQAAYANHACWPAHYYLGDLYRQRGELEAARRAYRVALQLLSGMEPDTGIKYVPFGLPSGEIRFLCEHQLGKLAAGQAPAGLS